MSHSAANSEMGGPFIHLKQQEKAHVWDSWGARAAVPRAAAPRGRPAPDRLHGGAGNPRSRRDALARPGRPNRPPAGPTKPTRPTPTPRPGRPNRPGRPARPGRPGCTDARRGRDVAATARGMIPTRELSAERVNREDIQSFFISRPELIARFPHCRPKPEQLSFGVDRKRILTGGCPGATLRRKTSGKTSTKGSKRDQKIAGSDREVRK
jgi:hypothetical protein